jgi:signal transduction histidine kinase
MIRQCLSSGTIFQREQAAHVTPNGIQRDLGVTISPIRRSNEKTTGAICLLTDLTELASLQKQMRLRENLAALCELSAGIAHEFKNALATISGYAQMIEADPAASDNAENAAKILSQTRSITHVVAEFLRYARPLDISEDSVALRPLLERVFTEIHQAQPTVEFALEGEFSQIAGDEGLLRQVFLNLVRNAAEAAAGSVLPAVTVQGTHSGAENSSQLIHILDNGPGLPPEYESKLFRPFFTTKIDGTGLGLAVVQKILLQHGAQITARNRPEGGAEFIITLPAAAQPHPEAVESKEVAI